MRAHVCVRVCVHCMCVCAGRRALGLSRGDNQKQTTAYCQRTAATHPLPQRRRHLPLQLKHPVALHGVLAGRRRLQLLQRRPAGAGKGGGARAGQAGLAREQSSGARGAGQAASTCRIVVQPRMESRGTAGLLACLLACRQAGGQAGKQAGGRAGGQAGGRAGRQAGHPQGGWGAATAHVSCWASPFHSRCRISGGLRFSSAISLQGSTGQ